MVMAVKFNLVKKSLLRNDVLNTKSTYLKLIIWRYIT